MIDDTHTRTNFARINTLNARTHPAISLQKQKRIREKEKNRIRFTHVCVYRVLVLFVGMHWKLHF